MASIPSAIRSRQRSGSIPWAFVGAFAVVVAVNIILAVEASRSWTGVVTETPFDTGNDAGSRKRRAPNYQWRRSSWIRWRRRIRAG